jgi:hypothetical protein
MGVVSPPELWCVAPSDPSSQTQKKEKTATFAFVTSQRVSSSCIALVHLIHLCSADARSFLLIRQLPPFALLPHHSLMGGFCTTDMRGGWGVSEPPSSFSLAAFLWKTNKEEHTKRLLRVLLFRATTLAHTSLALSSPPRLCLPLACRKLGLPHALLPHPPNHHTAISCENSPLSSCGGDFCCPSFG